MDFNLTNLTPYQQYTNVSWYKGVLKCIDEVRNELFIDYINNYFIPAINIQTSQNLYLSYYIRYLFGMVHPLGSSSTNSFYDTGEKYDSLTPNNNPIVYDDSEEYNGHISMQDFTILLRFVLNYGEEIFNLPMLIKFVSEICDINPNEIKIEFSNIDTIKFTLPNVLKATEFVKSTINYYDWLGLPIGINLDFAIELAE